MEVHAEARRILAVSLSKLYASRTQRGGLRLHRSLLLSMVMRTARDCYHSSRESELTSGSLLPSETPMDTGSDVAEQTGLLEPAQPESRSALCLAERTPEPGIMDVETNNEIVEDKENLSPPKQSRKRQGKSSAAPDFLPSKRARLETEEERYAAQLSSCRAGAGESLTDLALNRVIPAF